MESITICAETVSSYIFSEKFWFPAKNASIQAGWNDFREQRGETDIRYPLVQEMWIALPIALVLMFVRFMIEGLLFRPLAKAYAVKTARTDTNQNQTKVSRTKVQTTSDSVEKIVGECCWRGLFKFVMSCYGLFVLHDEHFFYSVHKSFERTWPKHHVKTEFYNYYMIEMGFYTQLLLTMRWDMKRRDTFEHILHHIVTLGLLSYSWIGNFIRIGLLIMLCFDYADPWLEMSKSFKSLGYPAISKRLFSLYTVLFCISRLFLYPYMILATCVWEYVNWYAENGHWPSCLAMVIFLVILFFVQLIWTNAVFKANRKLWKRKDTDVSKTSDSESEVSS